MHLFHESLLIISNPKPLWKYPLDLIRTLLAADTSPVSRPIPITSPSSSSSTLYLAPPESNQRYYRGVFDCTAKIVKREGLLSLYKGMGMSLVGICTYTSISFTTYDYLKDFFKIKGFWEKTPSSTGGGGASSSSSSPFSSSTSSSSLLHLIPPELLRLSCGISSVIVAQSISYPLDTIRRRLQVNASFSQTRVKYTGTLDVFRKIVWGPEGVRGLYRGLLVNGFKTSISGALQFLVYDYLQSTQIRR